MFKKLYLVLNAGPDRKLKTHDLEIYGSHTYFP
jgi:hypothetical protein